MRYPQNEKIFEYRKGSEERIKLEKELGSMLNETIEIPLIIDGKEIYTGKTEKAVCPHNHKKILAEYHCAGEKEINLAIEASMKAKKNWENIGSKRRANLFLRVAELLKDKWRYKLNSATMLNQSKNVYQAEIDSACELIDFLTFNPWYMEKIYHLQPEHHSNGCINSMEYRPLEGFVFAVSPFNFTAIAGNLTTAPALMGNTVVWKPSSTSILSNYYFMKILMEAGIPDGVINFIPGPGALTGDIVLSHKDFGGVHFTGSTGVFQGMWKKIGDNINKYKSYPRIVGETGGKDFIFAHQSADEEALVTALLRGSFEYQGQKCSACSRAYIPSEMWKRISVRLKEKVDEINSNMGNPEDFCFFNAVIDEKSFDKTMSYIDNVKNSANATVIAGGTGDKSKGYFIDATIIETSDPSYITMVEELFAPVLTVYPYEENKYEETLELCDKTSPYALTGAIFSNEQKAINIALELLRNSAGNFYINDKPTGAVVGQQPFGGARASGTNDKAGSMLNLLRWVSPRTLKETFCPATDYRYPFMNKE